MKKPLIALAIALFFSPIFAGIEGTLTNHLYYSGDTAAVAINIIEEFEGMGTLKLCLSNYDFNEGKYSSKCDIQLLAQNISIINQYSGNLLVNLINVPESAYRFYIQLSYKIDGVAKTRTDCDDGNFILIKASQQSAPENKGITLSTITPINASPNQEVTAYVNITNYEFNGVIFLSSFIKNETAYINENLNDDSFKRLNITPGSSAIIVMKNRLMENITQGVYNYIIKAESEGNIYQTFNTIEIIADEINNSRQNNMTCPEFGLCEECACETISCPQINQSAAVLEGQSSKITAKLNLKRDEYYYIPAILIGIISLIIMYVKLK